MNYLWIALLAISTIGHGGISTQDITTFKLRNQFGVANKDPQLLTYQKDKVLTPLYTCESRSAKLDDYHRENFEIELDLVDTEPLHFNNRSEGFLGDIVKGLFHPDELTGYSKSPVSGAIQELEFIRQVEDGQDLLIERAFVVNTQKLSTNDRLKWDQLSEVYEASVALSNAPRGNENVKALTTQFSHCKATNIINDQYTKIDFDPASIKLNSKGEITEGFIRTPSKFQDLILIGHTVFFNFLAGVVKEGKLHSPAEFAEMPNVKFIGKFQLSHTGIPLSGTLAEVATIPVQSDVDNKVFDLIFSGPIEFYPCKKQAAYCVKKGELASESYWDKFPISGPVWFSQKSSFKSNVYLRYAKLSQKYDDGEITWMPHFEMRFYSYFNQNFIHCGKLNHEQELGFNHKNTNDKCFFGTDHPIEVIEIGKVNKGTLSKGCHYRGGYFPEGKTVYPTTFLDVYNRRVEGLGTSLLGPIKTCRDFRD